jgi:hypothetical protein
MYVRVCMHLSEPDWVNALETYYTTQIFNTVILLVAAQN